MKEAVPCAIHADSVNAFNTSHFKIVIKRYYGDKKTLKIVLSQNNHSDGMQFSVSRIFCTFDNFLICASLLRASDKVEQLST